MAKMARATELPIVNVGHGMSRQVLAGKSLMLVVVQIEPGNEVIAHSHPHEQIGYVLSGRVIFRAGDTGKELGPGGVYSVEGGEEHSAQVVGNEPARLVEVFTPVREDFL